MSHFHIIATPRNLAPGPLPCPSIVSSLHRPSALSRVFAALESARDLRARLSRGAVERRVLGLRRHTSGRRGEG